MSFLRPLESFIGMFHSLLGMLVSGLVIFFPVVRGGSMVGVRSKFVEFCSSLVRVIWHSVSHPRYPLYLGTIRFFKLFNWEHSRRGPDFTPNTSGNPTLQEFVRGCDTSSIAFLGEFWLGAATEIHGS
jgi:hypothetical protein